VFCAPMALLEKAAPARRPDVNLTGFGVKEPPSDLCVSDSVRAAVTVMAKTLATDMAPHGITVNNVAPGHRVSHRARGRRGSSAAVSPRQCRCAASASPRKSPAYWRFADAR
jgi:NAD(P)-dependent dehydrogenase (short-subunit alcohol dehydrogenase family)